MPWFWQEPAAAPRKTKPSSEHEDSESWLSATHLLHPSSLIPAALLTTAVIYSSRLYKTYLRRIPNVSHIKPAFFRTQSLFGRVTSVGDADNFRLYHTPGGRLMGWHWARRVPSVRKELVDQTLHVRIAGVDAPELPHFGHPGQKYGAPAMDWLKATVDGRDLRVYPYARDQYGRVVASVKIRRWFGIPGLGTRDLGLEMVKAGWAEVYKAKGAEYGTMKEAYLDAEKQARSHHLGQWGGNEKRSLWGKFFSTGNDKPVVKEESPRDFKARMTREDATHKTEETPKRTKS